MGGRRSAWFTYFRVLLARGFLEARRHRHKLLDSVRAAYRGVGGALPCFLAGEAALQAPAFVVAPCRGARANALPRPRTHCPYAAVSQALEQRFQPQLTESQFARHVHELTNRALGHWTTSCYDGYQRCCLGIL